MDDSFRLKILIVENHADTLLYLTRYLEQGGHHVMGVADYEGALKHLKSWNPEVFICDIRLSEGSGLNLMQAVRNQPNAPYGVAMSGLSSNADKESSLKAGFSYHLAKPFIVEEFDSVLKKAQEHIAINRLAAKPV